MTGFELTHSRSNPVFSIQIAKSEPFARLTDRDQRSDKARYAPTTEVAQSCATRTPDLRLASSIAFCTTQVFLPWRAVRPGAPGRADGRSFLQGSVAGLEKSANGGLLILAFGPCFAAATHSKSNARFWRMIASTEDRKWPRKAC